MLTSNVQLFLEKLWSHFNQTYYRRTSTQLPSCFYNYLITPIANVYFYYNYFDQFSGKKGFFQNIHSFNS